MNETELIKRTINFCADVAINGISTETRLYGKEAIQKLSENPSAVADYLLETANEDPDVTFLTTIYNDASQ